MLDLQENSEVNSEEIDPQILSSLGLTKEDVQKVAEEERQILDQCKEKGMEIYRNLASGTATYDYIPLASDKKVPLNTHARHPQEFTYFTREKIAELSLQDKEQTKATLEGFGYAAALGQDYENAVFALDVVADGKLRQDANLLNNLKQAIVKRFGGMETEATRELVKLARVIQKKVGEKPVVETGPQPESTLRPAPPQQPSPTPEVTSTL